MLDWSAIEDAKRYQTIQFHLGGIKENHPNDVYGDKIILPYSLCITSGANTGALYLYSMDSETLLGKEYDKCSIEEINKNEELVIIYNATEDTRFSLSYDDVMAWLDESWSVASNRYF